MLLLEDSQIVAQHYKLNIDGIIGWISSKGVKMIKPMDVSSEQFNGLGIQTREFEDLDKQSNLLINIGFIGRLTDSSTTQYKLNIDGIVSGISSKGVKMIKPYKASIIYDLVITQTPI